MMKHIFLLAVMLGSMMTLTAANPTNTTTPRDAAHDAADESMTSDTLLRRQMESHGIKFTNNNSVTLLMTAQEKFDDLFEAIRQARHSIHLEYFNFRNDSIASMLFDLLRQKRSEGVEVRALFDGFGNDSNNQPLEKHHIEALRQDGIDIWEFDPIRFPWVNHIWPRDHRKIVVIDGQIAYTGGMNVADYYIKGTEQVGEWRDMHCRIEGGAVNQLQLIFTRMWQKVTGEDIWRQEYFRAYEPNNFKGLKPDTSMTAGKKQVGIINREPHRTNKIMRQFYISAIDAARDSVRIVNAYFTLTPGLKRALKRALDRGVKVEIMVSSRYDEPVTPDMALYNVHQLMKRGAHIWLYQPGFHHSKIMMVDGRFCTIGSSNLDARGMHFDYEENALVLDPSTTLQLDRMFDRDKQKCIKLTPEEWERIRTPWQKFRGWLYMRLFSVLL